MPLAIYIYIYVHLGHIARVLMYDIPRTPKEYILHTVYDLPYVSCTPVSWIQLSV